MRSVPPHLSTDGLYLDRAGRPVLEDVTLSFDGGTTYAVVGPSGAGKSSLLRCFNRLDEPRAGRVLLSGEDVRNIPPVELRRRVGLIGQTPIVFAGGVRRNLAYGIDYPVEEDLLDALEAVGLPAEFLDRPSDALSGGEAQRVCIARALVRDPEILLLDEPTSSLDRDALKTIEDLIRSLSARELTLIIVTHSFSQAARIASGAKLLVDGRLKMEGTMEQVESAWPKGTG